MLGATIRFIGPMALCNVTHTDDEYDNNNNKIIITLISLFSPSKP